MEIHGNDEELIELLRRLMPEFPGDRLIILRASPKQSPTDSVVKRMDVTCASSCPTAVEMFAILDGAARGLQAQINTTFDITNRMN